MFTVLIAIEIILLLTDYAQEHDHRLGWARKHGAAYVTEAPPSWSSGLCDQPHQLGRRERHAFPGWKKWAWRVQIRCVTTYHLGKAREALQGGSDLIRSQISVSKSVFH